MLQELKELRGKNRGLITNLVGREGGGGERERIGMCMYLGGGE